MAEKFDVQVATPTDCCARLQAEKVPVPSPVDESPMVPVGVTFCAGDTETSVTVTVHGVVVFQPYGEVQLTAVVVLDLLIVAVVVADVSTMPFAVVLVAVRVHEPGLESL